MADLIRGTTPSYIVDFTDSGVNVEDITKATLTAKYRCVKTDLSDGLVLDPVENVIRYHFFSGRNPCLPCRRKGISGDGCGFGW